MTDQIKPGDLVERTGESDMGLTKGHHYPVYQVRGSGHLILHEDDEGWPILFHRNGFKRVGSGTDG